MAAAFCPACGAKLAPGAPLCEGCGHDLANRPKASMAEMTACPACASLVRAGTRFCSACGEPVGEPSAPPEIAPPPPVVAPAGAHDAVRPPAVPSGPEGAAAPSPPPPAPTGSAPPLVPRAPAGAGPATAAGLPAPPPEPTTTAPRAFVTYMPLPAATPPVDTAALENQLPAPPAPAAPAAPVSALTSGTPAPAPVIEKPPPAPPAPPQPKAPAPPGEGWSRGRVIAIVATVALLVGSVVAALVLSGGSDTPKPAATAAARDTPRPERTRAASKPDLRTQVRTLDDLMKASAKGRAAAVEGDTKAAIANRSKLLEDLQRLSSTARDGQLKAGLRSFAAAIRESLRQNRECGAKCPASELEKVNRLKEQTVARLNPLLRKYAKTSYRGRDI